MDEDEDRITSVVDDGGDEDEDYYDDGDENKEQYYDYDEDDAMSKLTIDSTLIERVDSRSLAGDKLANGNHSSLDFVDRWIDECQRDLSEAQNEGKSLMKNTLSGKKKKRDYVCSVPTENKNDMISDEENEDAATQPPSVKRVRARAVKK